MKIPVQKDSEGSGLVLLLFGPFPSDPNTVRFLVGSRFNDRRQWAAGTDDSNGIRDFLISEISMGSGRYLNLIGRTYDESAPMIAATILTREELYLVSDSVIHTRVDRATEFL